MNTRAVGGQRWKRCLWDAAELLLLPRRRVFPIVLYEMGFESCAREILRLRVGKDESAGAARQPARKGLSCCRLWKVSWNRPRAAIRSHR